MMPKTAAYLAIVVLGYRYFVGEFKHKNILGMAFANLIMGLIGGVFYREFTKFYGYTKPSHLSIVHVHSLVLGFIVMLIIYMLTKGYKKNQIQSLKKPIYIFEAGIIFTITNMMVIGIYEVVGLGEQTINRAAIDGISGLGHITLAVGLVWTIIKIYKEDYM